MKIKVSKVMKAKTSYTSQRETVVTSSFRACSFAMDDGGRCLLDVINDPKLLQSFLESGSDENSKDPQDGTSSESAVESPQVSRSSHSTLANHLSSTEHIVDQSDQMGYSYVDSQGLLAQGGVCPTAGGLGGMSLIVASTAGQQAYQHASTGGNAIHHLPSVAHANLHPHSPASARSVTPVSQNIKSPGQGPSSVHSMPPPSPLQQTRSPLPSHTPSPAPVWSPVPPVLSPATSRTQSSMPSVAFQQSHNQILQTSCSVTQFVTALATQQSITQKLTLQQQQQLFLQQQLSPASQQQSSPRLTTMSAPVVTTTAVGVQQPMVQLIHAPSNVAMPTRTSHSAVRPIQPKLPPQILPKPATCTASNQFVPPTPAPKPPPPTPVTTAQRTVGVGLQPGAQGQLVINQGQPGVFQGPQGTILLNQIIPGMGQSPIIFQGNLSNLANIPGLQLTLRPPSSASPGQSLNSTNPQNNATLIAALQGPSQHAQTLFTQAKSPMHGQPTIVIPNNITHAHPGLAQQNINLTSAGIPNSGIISSSNSQGQSFLTRSNIILSPRVVGGNQSLQLQQIQTPNGPILAFAPSQTITVPHLPTALGNAQLAPVTLPMHGVMTTGQGVISGLSLQSHAPQSALQHQSLFGTAVPFTSHLEQSSPHVIQVPQPMAPQQVPTNHPGHIQNQHQQQIDHSPKPASPPKPSKVPGVNLEELLKEHGIVPENSPVPSPECQSPIMEEQVPSQPIIPSPQQQLIQALQSQQVLLEQAQGPNPLSQIKLSFTQDGSFILHQPHGHLGNSRVQHYVSSGQMLGRTVNSNTVSQVIFPTATTPTVSVPASTSESPRNHSTLIARLNAAPAISVPDVSSLALTTSVGLSTTSCTTITTSATTLVPLTVQSLSVNSSPIASSYIVQRTNTTTTPSDRLFIAEDVHTSQSRVAPVISSSSSSAQSVHKVINHTNSTFQTLVVPNEHPNSRTTVQHTPKTVQSSRATVTKNSQAVHFDVQKCGHRETHVVEIANDNGTSVVPSHNHAAFPSNVPNHMLLRVQKEIHELGVIKNRNPEQQKIFNQLINAQQKLMSPLQNKSKASRANQNQLQLKIESEVEKLLLRSQTCRTAIVNDHHHHHHQPLQQQQQQPQLPPKAPVLITQQQPNQIEKPQNANVKALNSHNLHLVNLLKQNPPHATPVRHIAPPTTTITTVCDSTTPTVTAPSSTQQKTNQVILPPPQPRMITPHPQNTTKPATEVPQPQQVIVRLQKPVQQPQPPVQTCPTAVQIKVPPPVKRIINTVPKTVLIKEQLSKDQNAVINPDIKKPFQSKEDACRRLLQYHVFNNRRDPSWTDLQEDDRKFTERSVLLLDKISALNSKYRLLQMENSMRLCVTPDQVLMERLFIQDEKEALQSDKAAVAEGRHLSLPPPPQSWLPRLKALCRSPSPMPPPVVIKEEIPSDPEDNDCRDLSDHPTMEDSDPVYKEDDNLEAPVIDSCEDIVPPPHDDNCDRSPPTLKRIVIKPSRCSESDPEDLLPSRKRLKFNNNVVVKSENDVAARCDWSKTEAPKHGDSKRGHSDWSRTTTAKHGEKEWSRTVAPKHSDKSELNDWSRTTAPKHSDNNKDLETKANHKFPLLTRETFHSDNTRIDDMVFDMSPMEMGEDSRGVDMNTDFEPPVPRTEESSDNLLYNSSSLRNNCADKYDFDLLACPDWTEEYVHNQSESDMGVENIIINDHPSDLDLSGLDGLDDHLEDDQHCIPNGNDSSDMNICYLIPKHSSKRFLDPAQNCSSARDQVQSAIKSITENRSYFEADFHLPLSRHGHNYGGSGGVVSEGGPSSNHRGEHDLEEAVRSILL